MGNFCVKLSSSKRSIDEPLRPRSRSASSTSHRKNSSDLGSDRSSPPNVLPDLSKEELAFKTGITKFNVKPKEGIQYLIDSKLLDANPGSIVEFLHSKRLFRGQSELRSGLSKRQIGFYLGAFGNSAEELSFHKQVLEGYVRKFAFSGKELDIALREFLTAFRLPGESQAIDRIIEQFAKCYHSQNSSRLDYSNEDTVYVLAFAMIILNTDAHNPNVKKKFKMTRTQFIKMCSGIEKGADVRRPRCRSFTII